ncbi:MAG: hypothetical protein JJT82_02495 [Legionellaceae bacterium]|nr:hypothetical protein [Legionellaceae bacterium]
MGFALNPAVASISGYDARLKTAARETTSDLSRQAISECTTDYGHNLYELESRDDIPREHSLIIL